MLSQRGVKENTKRWGVKRAEAFVRAVQGLKLLDRTIDDFNYYLEKQGIEKN